MYQYKQFFRVCDCNMELIFDKPDNLSLTALWATTLCRSLKLLRIWQVLTKFYPLGHATLLHPNFIHFFKNNLSSWKILWLILKKPLLLVVFELKYTNQNKSKLKSEWFSLPSIRITSISRLFAQTRILNVCNSKGYLQKRWLLFAELWCTVD